MLDLLGDKLKTWQTDNKSCFFSILYSDIGKSFYSKHGWHPYPSKHITFSPSQMDVSTNLAEKIGPSSSIWESLCEIDEHDIRLELSTKSTKAQVSLIPDYDTVRWHHLREDFIVCIILPRNLCIYCVNFFDRQEVSSVDHQRPKVLSVAREAPKFGQFGHAAIMVLPMIPNQETLCISYALLSKIKTLKATPNLRRRL
jgi:hypothetical protein